MVKLTENLTMKQQKKKKEDKRDIIEGLTYLKPESRNQQQKETVVEDRILYQPWVVPIAKALSLSL